MTTKQLAQISKLNQSLAPTFRSIVTHDPEISRALTWAQEKTFLEAQIRKHWQIERAVVAGVAETVESIKLAVREAASMGLSMSPQAQLIYLIPRRARKKWDNESKADYERNVPWLINATPSYRGLVYIGTHYAGAELVAGEVVFQADHFRYLGPIKEPEHEPTLDNAKRDERVAIGAYAVVLMSSGAVRAEYTDAPTIQRIRSLSEFPGGLMWTKLWTEGWRKVPIRRICKTVLVTDRRMVAANTAMERTEGIVLDGDVPRETPPGESGNGAQEPERPRGMSGLGSALNRQKTRQEDAREPIELDPGDYGPLTAEPEEAPAAAEEDLVPDPAPSRNPPGSIEYWGDQIRAACDLDRMEMIKVAALAARVDMSEDAEPFRRMFSTRYRELKAAP